MRKFTMLAAILAMVMLTAVPALAHTSVVFEDDVDNDVWYWFDISAALGGDQSQNAVNDSEQLLFQDIDQSNTINGDQTATATGSGSGDVGAAAGNSQENSVSTEQTQYSVNLLYGGLF